jgi:hypothetical protein
MLASPITCITLIVTGYSMLMIFSTLAAKDTWHLSMR